MGNKNCRRHSGVANGKQAWQAMSCPMMGSSLSFIVCSWLLVVTWAASSSGQSLPSTGWTRSLVSIAPLAFFSMASQEIFPIASAFCNVKPSAQYCTMMGTRLQCGKSVMGLGVSHHLLWVCFPGVKMHFETQTLLSRVIGRE